MFSGFQSNAFQNSGYQIVIPTVKKLFTTGGISPNDYRRYRKRMERLRDETKRFEEEKNHDRKELDRIIRLAFKTQKENTAEGIETKIVGQQKMGGSNDGVRADDYALIARIQAQIELNLAKAEREFAALVRLRMMDEEIAITLLC